jgi:peptide chain release factor
MGGSTDLSMPIALSLQARLDSLGVRASDIEERFIRGGGPGGQKINKTSSTVWLLHRPSGIEVRCQAERSQAANRQLAWMEMCHKLEARIQSAKRAAQDELEKGRRQARQKSYGQKVKMIQSKKHRARHKALRGRVGDDS